MKVRETCCEYFVPRDRLLRRISCLWQGWAGRASDASQERNGDPLRLPRTGKRALERRAQGDGGLDLGGWVSGKGTNWTSCRGRDKFRTGEAEGVVVARWVRN